MQTSTESKFTVKTSKRIFEEACTYIPGGVTAHIKYMTPHPIVMNEAKGSKLKDVDGNTYIDYLLCSGSLLTGHGHPAITEAVTNQLHDMGTTISVLLTFWNNRWRKGLLNCITVLKWHALQTLV